MKVAKSVSCIVGFFPIKKRAGGCLQKKLIIAIIELFFFQSIFAQPRFHALVLFENGGHHLEFTNAAQPWLNKLAADSNFAIDYITEN